MTIDELAVQGTTDPTDYFGPIPGLHRQGWVSVWGLHRDSDILDKSNWDVILEDLNENHDNPDEFRVESSAHWAVGWLDTLLVLGLQCKCVHWADSDIKMETTKGEAWYCWNCHSYAHYTPILQKMLEYHRSVADYAILDEVKYSEMEYLDLTDYLAQEVPDEEVEHLALWLSEEHSATRADDVEYKWIEEWKEMHVNG